MQKHWKSRLSTYRGYKLACIQEFGCVLRIMGVSVPSLHREFTDSLIYYIIQVYHGVTAGNESCLIVRDFITKFIGGSPILNNLDYPLQRNRMYQVQVHIQMQ